MRNLLLILIIIRAISVQAQCNGAHSLCNTKYNEISYLTTHNAFNCTNNGYLFPNQNISISEQLNLGVRGFMLDLYDLFGTVTVYHGTFLLGSQPFSEILQEFNDYLSNNSNEVITIILENNVSPSQIETSFQNAGLLSSLYSHDPGTEWPTLQQLIDNGKNIVLFNDQDNALPSQTWNHYMWTNMVETHFSVSDPSLFTNDFNRGDSINDLFIFNHFVTDASIGIGLENQAVIVNEYNFLMNRIQENYSLKHKLPNFITLDFVDIGDGIDVINDINQNGLTLIENTFHQMSVYPNPSTTEFYLSREPLIGAGHCQLEIIDLMGKKVHIQSIDSPYEEAITTAHLPRGTYLLKIHNDSDYLISVKIVLK